MKSLIILPMMYFFFGIGPSLKPEAPIAQEKLTERVELRQETHTNGIVHLVTKGCGVYIEIKSEGKTLRLYPVNLDQHFKKDGLKISFDYALSRAMQPADCAADFTVSVSNVKLRE